MATTSASEAQRAAWGWGTTLDDAEARAFLAQRVAVYARQVGAFFTLLYVVGFVSVAAFATEQLIPLHLHPAKLANLVEIVIAYGVWWAVRRPGRSNAALIAGDAVLPLLVNLGAALAAPFAPQGFAVSFIPMLVSALALMFRAAFVPSPPARTICVGALASLPTIWAQYALAAGSTTPLPGFLTPTLTALGSAIWCVAIVAGTALVSKEVYGLHTEVAKAQRLGQYTIERKLGEGGMGAVYVARHARLRRPTAIKLLSPERMSSESVARFEREVQLTSQLAHPNTVAVYDYGRSLDGVFYYAMEYVDGLSLAELVDKHGPAEPGRVIHILRQAADALVEAHDLGLIHRDVKPQNILLCERAGKTDVVKLVDFGLVKDVRGADPSLTQTNTITGTPLYLAPETITDPASVDHRVDIYALGAVGYCLLTGTPPFQGRSTVEVCGQHLHTPPVPPSQRTSRPLPAALESLLLRCLAKRREDRPQSARELERALGDCALAAPWNEDDAREFWARWRETTRSPLAAGAGARHG